MEHGAGVWRPVFGAHGGTEPAGLRGAERLCGAAAGHGRSGHPHCDGAEQEGGPNKNMMGKWDLEEGESPSCWEEVMRFSLS